MSEQMPILPSAEDRYDKLVDTGIANYYLVPPPETSQSINNLGQRERTAIPFDRVPIPREVIDIVHAGALLEDELRAKGYNKERIGAQVGRLIVPNLARLLPRRIDTSRAFAPRLDDE